MPVKAILLFSAFMGLMSCTGPDDGRQSTNNGSNNANNTSNSATNDTSGSTASDQNTNQNTNQSTNGSTNTDTTTSRAEPYIGLFTYRYPGVGHTQTLYFASDGTLGTGTLTMGNRQRLPDDVAAEFEAAHMDADTIARMQNGWDCRVVDQTTVETQYWFEARIIDNGTTVMAQDVTGCVQDDDPDVVAIIDAMQRLATIYL